MENYILNLDGNIKIIRNKKSNDENKKIVKGYICCIKENVDINFTENQQFTDIFEFCDKNNFYLKSIYYDTDIPYKQIDDDRVGLSKLLDEINKDEICVMMNQKCLYQNGSKDANFINKLENKKSGFMIIDFLDNINIIEDLNGNFIFKVTSSILDHNRKIENKKIMRNSLNKK